MVNLFSALLVNIQQAYFAIGNCSGDLADGGSIQIPVDLAVFHEIALKDQLNKMKVRFESLT